MFRAISPIAASRIQPLGPLEGIAAVMRWPRLPGLELEITFISSIAITAGAAQVTARAEGAPGRAMTRPLFPVRLRQSRASESRRTAAPVEAER